MGDHAGSNGDAGAAAAKTPSDVNDAGGGGRAPDASKPAAVRLDAPPAAASAAPRSDFEKKRLRHASGESTVSTDSVGHYIPTPPDGGFGWVIVVAAFFNHVIVDGICYTFGIFYVEFLDQFGASKGKTSLVGSLLAGCYLFIAPVASALVNKYGCQPVSVAGAIIATIGFISCTLSPNIDILIFTYGAIGGCGLGLLYLPNIVAVSHYFQERRALATGIAVCGAGVGCFTFAPLGQFLLSVYDWKNAMLIVAGITLQGCVFGSLLRPLQPVRRPRRVRAKNILDRLKEQTAHRMGRHRTESECSTGSVPAGVREREVMKRIQMIKWAKEKALKEEDGVSDYGSVQNSTRYLDRDPDGSGQTRPIPIPSRMNSVGGGGGGSGSAGTSAGDGGATFSQSPIRSPSDLAGIDEDDIPRDMVSSPTRPSLIWRSRMNSITEEIPEDDILVTTTQSHGKPQPVRPNMSTVSFTPSVTYIPRTSNAGTPTHGQYPSGVLSSPLHDTNEFSDRYAESCRLRLPQGIHRQDFARPMYRSDIFYSGSIVHIPEYKSQTDVQTYVRSITTIPETVHPTEECWLWRFLPISKAAKDTLKKMLDLSLLREPLFFVPALGNVLATFGLYIPFVFLAERAMSFGIDDSSAAFLLSVTGITNTIGRVLAGSLADLKWFNSLLMHNVALLIGGVACLLNMLLVTYPMMCVFAAVFGLCVATWVSLTSIVLCNLLGIEKLTNAFGLLCMSRGFSAVIGSPIAGIIFDMTQNYDAPFVFSGIMLLFGSGVCFILHLQYFQRRITSDGRANQSGDGNDMESSSLTGPPSRGTSFLARPSENGMDGKPEQTDSEKAAVETETV